MYILPEPQSIKFKNSNFYLKYDCSIIISSNCDLEVYDYAQILKESIIKELGFSLAITKGKAKKDSIYLL